MADDAVKNLVMVKHEACLSCHHLLGFVDQVGSSDQDCFGDDQCPAVDMRINLGLNINKTSADLAQAFNKNDVPTINHIMSDLTKYDPIIQDKVMRLARSKTK